MWRDLIGVPFDGAKSPPNNEGDGLRMAIQAGARLGNVNQVWWSPGGMQIVGETYEGQPRKRANGGVHRRPGAIVVNRQRKRFMNENMPLSRRRQLLGPFGRPEAYVPQSPGVLHHGPRHLRAGAHQRGP